MGRNGKLLFKEYKVSLKQGEYFLEISHIIVTIVAACKLRKFVKKNRSQVRCSYYKKERAEKFLEVMFIILIVKINGFTSIC